MIQWPWLTDLTLGGFDPNTRWSPSPRHFVIASKYCLCFLPSPCLCSNQDSRIIDWHGPGARRPIGVIDQRIICYEIGDSEYFFRFANSDLIIVVPSLARTSKVNFSIGEIEVFWLSWQLWRLRCSFGTTSLPSGWRSISFGNPSWISWRDCTSFSATCLSLTPFALFYTVSLTSLLYFYIHYFLAQTGENLTETTCWKISWVNGGS